MKKYIRLYERNGREGTVWTWQYVEGHTLVDASESNWLFRWAAEEDARRKHKGVPIIGKDSPKPKKISPLLYVYMM